MYAVILALVNLASAQGEAVEVTVPHEPGLQAVHAEWGERRVPFVRDGDRWLTVIGVDLDAEPGAHALVIEQDLGAAGTQRDTGQVIVAAKQFPTTELTVEPGYVELSPENQERAAREAREIDAIYANLTPERYWSEPFEVPVPGTTGGRNFGHRRVFNGQPRNPHSGADLNAGTGTPIQAANRGRVVLAKDLFFSGNAVFLDHGLGVYSVYLHLSEILAEPGQMLEKGEVLGLAGATGRVTGPHLHWGVRVLDARVDPFSLLDLGAD
ncbi:MAG TPA: M23 family metallopeptidase [Gammaproteobacteria bacterium]|nr:M23 family metallopeptidase [Gammaproteobacteria bacterium]